MLFCKGEIIYSAVFTPLQPNVITLILPEANYLHKVFNCGEWGSNNNNLAYPNNVHAGVNL